MSKIIACTLFLLSCTTFSYAQQTQLGCNDRKIRLQSEQIKIDLKPQGLVSYKDAMLTMESREAMPIVVQLTKGKTYQMVFIGNETSSKMIFELLDGEDNIIDKKVLTNLNETNQLAYTFVPEKSDAYLITLTQVFKGRSTTCGSFTIFEKTEASQSK